MRLSLRSLCTLSCSLLLLTACCVTTSGLREDPRIWTTEPMFGSPDKVLLLRAIETELERRAYKDELKRAGLPNTILLNDTFREVATKVLLAVREQLSVYGDDDRQEAFASTRTAEVARSIRATAAVFYDLDLTELGPGLGWEMTQPVPALKDKGVCETADLDGDGVPEPQLFVEQPARAICTAFLIDKDVVVTAGHCAPSDFEVTERLFVFDYLVQTDPAQPPTWTNDQVFRGKRLGGVYVPHGEDWAVVRLEREVSGRDPLPLRSTGDVPDNEPVYMVGYPSGLPAKYAGNAEVIRNDLGLSYFVANLDAFRSNSGSPVFNVSTNEVEGILVGGERDYVSIGRCSVPEKCPNNGLGCSGERVTRIKYVKYIP
jgi:hypothetical protein